MYSLKAGGLADNLLGSPHDVSIWCQSFWSYHESPESNRLRQDVAKEPLVGRACIELLGVRPICGPLVCLWFNN